MKVLHFYQSKEGKSPFRDWFEILTAQSQVRVQTKLDRVALGNLGDVKPVGEGVHELRLNFGSGFRIYFANENDKIILLLNGGDKSSQDKDIRRAKEFYAEYKKTK